VLVACLVTYLFTNDGKEGIFLVIGGMLTTFLLIFEFGKVPVLLRAKTGNLIFEGIQEIRYFFKDENYIVGISQM
jgi:hypothetical protein